MLTISPTGVDITDLVTDPTNESLDTAATLWLINNGVVDTVDDDAQLLFEDSMITLPNEEICNLVAAGRTRSR